MHTTHHSNHDGVGELRSMRKRFRQLLISQFKHPKGLLGRVAGSIMANRESNQRRNRWTVDLLDFGTTDRILEIGFGPGLALARAAAKATDGQIVGIDQSQTMLSVAAARNRAVIQAGRMVLHVGTAEDLDAVLDPCVDIGFQHIYAVNVVMFWSDPVAVLKTLGQRLAPLGQIALTLQPRLGDASNEASIFAGNRIHEQMRAAGLANIRTEYLRDLSPMAVCVIGTKSEAAA